MLCVKMFMKFWDMNFNVVYSYFGQFRYLNTELLKLEFGDNSGDSSCSMKNIDAESTK